MESRHCRDSIIYCTPLLTKFTSMESAEKTTTFFRFEDLRIYHKAIDYVKWVYITTKEIPNQSNDQLIKKFNSASKDISLNIAEGSARNKSQFIYYLKMAKSSIRECLVFTSIIAGLELIDENSEEYSRNQLMEMTKMIGALISSLQRGTKREENHNDESSPNINDNPDY